MALNICGTSHDEIAYEGKYCPLCEVLHEKSLLEEKLYDTEQELLKAEEANSGC